MYFFETVWQGVKTHMTVKTDIFLIPVHAKVHDYTSCSYLELYLLAR